MHVQQQAHRACQRLASKTTTNSVLPRTCLRAGQHPCGRHALGARDRSKVRVWHWVWAAQLLHEAEALLKPLLLCSTMGPGEEQESAW